MLLPNEDKESHHRLKLSEILKPKFNDLYILFASIIPTFFFLRNSFAKHNFHVFTTCNSAILNAMMAKTMYLDDKSFRTFFNRNKLDRYYSFPLYPIIFRFTYYMCFKSWNFATVLIITSLSFLCNYFFSRFLICTRFIKDPLISTFILLFELIYIGQQTRSFKLLSISSFLIIITNDCGFFIVLGFLISSILTKSKKQFRYLFFTYLAGIFVISVFHKSLSGRFFPIFSNFLAEKRFPFKELFNESHTIGRLRQLHGIYNYYIIPLLACLMSISIDKSIGIPLFLSLLYSSTKFGYLAVDSTCPIEAISILIGFDALIRHPRFKSALYILAPLYIISIFYLTSIKFNSHRDLNSTQFSVYNM